ncbi:3'-5' exonuclease [Nocardiopsis coralliicola]
MLQRGRAARPAAQAVVQGALTRIRGTGRPARSLDYAVVDLETTGLDPAAGARIVEAAVVRMRGDGTVSEEFSTLIDPRGPVAGEVFHGIAAGDTVGAPAARDVAADLARLLSGAVVVGHNLDFEAAFLTAELAPGLPGRLPGLCTLRALRSQLDLERYSLPHASKALSGEWPTAQHTALGDARACARILAELLAAAPGPLYYSGPEPQRWSAEGLPRAARIKPRTRPRGALGARPGAWPDAWRADPLPPELCGGAFTAQDRADAAAAAAARRTRRDTAASAAVLAGTLAAAGAAGSLLRALR